MNPGSGPSIEGNILLKNLLDAMGGAMGFFLLGYGFAYGGSNGPFTPAVAMGQPEKLFVGMILILIFAEALGLTGLVMRNIIPVVSGIYAHLVWDRIPFAAANVEQQAKLFVGMILILIFAGNLDLYGLIVALILTTLSDF